MRQITLRDIPEDVESLARAEARRKGVSLNKALLALLRRGAECQPNANRRLSPVARHDFIKFLGAWSREEADACDAAVAEQRGIDSELWS